MKNTQIRIQEIIDYLNISVPEFATECKITKTTIYNYLKGKPASTRNLKKILIRYEELSEPWLFTGRGPMFAPRKLNELDKHLDFYSAMRIIEYTNQNMVQIEADIREMRKSMTEFIDRFKEYYKVPKPK
jgi:hypothetical protein